MPNMKIISIADIAELIPDGAVVSISSSSGLGCPDSVLKAIGQAFEATSHPQNLTTIHPIAAGDMYGIDGIDHIARDGLLKRVIAGSYPSGPSSMPSPKIWTMIYENRVEAYNIPSGILFHMHREAAAKRPGILTQVGMDTFVDPRRTGGRMNDSTTENIVRVVDFDNDEWLYFPSIPVDVAIIRGTTADTHGNISMEHEGGFLGVYDQAVAARNNGGIVIAQVKRLAENGSLSPQMIRIPSILVDYVVVEPEQMQTTKTLYNPAISGEIKQSLHDIETLNFDIQKVIARRAALELLEGDVVNLGFGISALVPQILTEEGLHDAVTWVIEQGAVGGLPLTDFQFGCAANPQAIVTSSDQFTYFQGGGFDRTMLSFMQIDRYGNVNVSHLAARPHVTAGVGGFIDITANAKHLIFSGYFTAGGLKLDVKNQQVHILQEGKVQKLVNEVEHVTFSGREAIRKGQHVVYITERCVMELTAEGLMVTEIAPGIDIHTSVLDKAGFPLLVSPNLKLMDSRLYAENVMGLMQNSSSLVYKG